MLTAERHRYRGYHDLLDDYVARGWTDGLPIVPPTPESVERFLARSRLDADEMLGEIPSRSVAVRAEQVAINAVMAGCRADYMPVVVAAVRALLRPEANAHSTTATLSGAAQMIIVHGPVRNELGVAYGAGCFGPGFHANATIGRAVRLVVRNVCRSLPGGFDRAAFATPARYSFCFGEDEEGSPWPSLLTSRGNAPTASAVTVMSVVQTLLPQAPPTSPDALLEDYVSTLHQDARLWEERMGSPADLVCVVAPEHARCFADGGSTREWICDELWTRMQGLTGRRGSYSDGEQLRLTGPGDILLLAAGGPGKPIAAFHIPHVGRAVTEVIEPA